MIDVRIQTAALDLESCMKKAADTGSGGTVVFVGTVRDNTDGRPVIRLEFEAYHEMAHREMMKIAETATIRWSVSDILIHHREGPVAIGETAVIIITSAPRRDAAFLACRYAIDTLKETVPIWKKEIFEDGSEWVSAHP